MKNNKIFYFIVILIVAIFFVLLLGLKEEKNYSPQSENKKLNNSISLKELYSGKNIFLNDLLLENELNLINIWASWCLPCREEHPYLVKLKKNSPIKIIGINYKDKKNNALKFLDEFENPYFTILNDKNGTASIEIGAYGVPESLILNKEKKIIKKIIGPIDNKKFNEIKKLLKK